MQNEIELWKWVVGYEGQYEVSNKGQVRTYWKGVGIHAQLYKKPQKLLTPIKTPTGHLYVKFSKIQKFIHRLVLEAFVGSRPMNNITRHLDGNPKNNDVNNLRWGTPKENVGDAIKHGVFIKGERAPSNKLTEQEVLFILQHTEFNGKQLSSMFSVHPSIIYNIRNGKIWKHLTWEQNNC